MNEFDVSNNLHESVIELNILSGAILLKKYLIIVTKIYFYINKFNLIEVGSSRQNI